jgi:hypothetical protein
MTKEEISLLRREEEERFKRSLYRKPSQKDCKITPRALPHSRVEYLVKDGREVVNYGNM